MVSTNSFQRLQKHRQKKKERHVTLWNTGNVSVSNTSKNTSCRVDVNFNFNYIHGRHWSGLCLYWEGATVLDSNTFKGKSNLWSFFFVDGSFSQDKFCLRKACRLHGKAQSGVFCVTWLSHSSDDVCHAQHSRFGTNMLLSGNVLSYELGMISLITWKKKKKNHKINGPHYSKK